MPQSLYEKLKTVLFAEGKSGFGQRRFRRKKRRADQESQKLEDRCLLTLTVGLGGTGGLLITESSVGADDISISTDNGTNEHVITENNGALLTTLIGSASGNNTPEIRVPFGALSDDVIEVLTGVDDDNIEFPSGAAGFNPGASFDVSVVAGLDNDTVTWASPNSIATVSAQSEAITLGSNLVTTGVVSLDGAVTLLGNSMVTGSEVTFDSTVDGAFGLIVNSSGTTTFGDQVGITTPLASLTTDAGGTTLFGEGTGGANALTAVTATFNDAVIVDQANTRLRTTGDLTFNSTIDAGADAGGEQLILQATGGVLTTAGDIGTTTPFSTFQVDNGATGHNLGGNISTTSVQTYRSAITLGSNATLTSSSSDVFFNTNVNGAFDLTVNSPGITLFTNGAGAITPLASITTDAAGSSDVSVTFSTTGDQTWNDSILLGGNLALTGAALTLDDVNLDGFDLVANMTGEITVGGDLSATTTSSISLTTERNIALGVGSAITVADGNLTLSANQQGATTTGDFRGLAATNATITTSGTGNILIEATGGDSVDNEGVFLQDTDILSTATGATAGTITVNGVSHAADGAEGAAVRFRNQSLIESADGDITIDGVSDNYQGVYFLTIGGGTVRSLGTGADAANITITGESLGSRSGIQIDPGTITSVDGDISATGITDTGFGYLLNAGSITTSGDGEITLVGNGGSFGAFHNQAFNVATQGADIFVSGSGTTAIRAQDTSSIVSNGGNITLDSDSILQILGTGNRLISGTGNITLTSDQVQLDAPIQGSGELTVVPKAIETSIGLGGGAGTLNLTAAEIARLADGFNRITIGDAATGTGAVEIDGAAFSDQLTIVGGSISVTGLDTGSNNLSLTARTGGITDGGDAEIDVTGGQLTVVGQGGFGTGGDAIETAVTNLRATLSAGGFYMANTGNMNIIIGAGEGVTVGANQDIVIDVIGALNPFRALTTSGTGTVSLSATENIFLGNDAARIFTDTGDITLVADSDENGSGLFRQGNFQGLISSSSGNLSVVANDIELLGDIDVGSGSVTLTSAQNILLQNDGGTREASITADSVTLSTASDANLASYYDFENDVLDSTGPANGTVIGTTQFSATVPAAISGRSSSAFDFNGSSAVELPIGDIDPYALASSTGLTLSYWVRADAQGERYTFSTARTTTNSPLYGLQAGVAGAGQDDNIRFFHRDDTNSQRSTAVTSTDDILSSPLQYHHIVFTDVNGDVEFYVDGVRDATDFDYTPGPVTVDRVGIGALLRSNNGFFLTGQIDDFAIYDRALTQAEVTRLANGTAPTAANLGTLDFGGAITSNTINIPSDVVVETGSSFGGIGSVAGSVTVESGGTFTPGNSPGILNTGDFDLQVGSTLEIEIGGVNPGNTVNDHDQVNVTGSVTLAGDINALRFNGFNPAAGDTFTIINNDLTDAVSGTFNGLAEGAEFTTDSVTYSVSYVGGDGNDVVLTAIGVVFTVSNTSDSGAGSLRQAILDANALPGPNTIEFDITSTEGTGPHTITPTTLLPEIADVVTINGYTETGASQNTLDAGSDASLTVVLDGSTVSGSNGFGLDIDASDTVVRGLVFANWNDQPGGGIRIQATADNVTVAGNHIGTDVTGNVLTGTGGRQGIAIVGGNNHSIGGDSVADRNVIAGFDFGVGVSGGDGIVISGNYIGIGADGTTPLGVQTGVLVNGPAMNITIGGTGVAERNVISGGSDKGLRLLSGNVVVTGNYIGTDATGTIAIPNITQGIQIDGATATIGGTTTDERNVISGSGLDGILVSNVTATITGNYIGTNAAGTAAIANGRDGIRIVGGTNHQIGGATAGERNVISGNTADGISITGATTDNTVIAGNFIGTNAAGTAGLANVNGVRIQDAANTTVGGNSSATRNVISGNQNFGVSILSPGANTKIQGNFIGTGVDSTVAIGNGFASASGGGINASNFGSNPIIVGSDGDANEGNVISGNVGFGVRLGLGGGTTGGNTVAGNMIGVDASGTIAVGNTTDGVFLLSPDNTIGGLAPVGSSATVVRNVISGNLRDGVHIGGGVVAATGNVVQGNLIGLAANGEDPLGNLNGVVVEQAAGAGTIIGVDTTGLLVTPDQGNFISGNTGDGIRLLDGGVLVSGNFIGPDDSGTTGPGNDGDGIFVISGANTIAGLGTQFTNTIAFNSGNGVTLADVAAGNSDVSQNLIYGNLGLGIDVGDDGFTANAGGDGFLDFPEFTNATINVAGTELTLTGEVDAGIEIQLYSADPLGQGEVFLLNLTEGSAADTDSAAGFFEFVVPLPAGVANGTLLTGLAVGSTSEFSPTIPAGEQTSAVPPVVNAGTNVLLDVGDTLQASGSFTDFDSTSWTATVDYGDGSGVQALALNDDLTFDLSHTYDGSGSFTVSVAVTDNSLAVGMAQFTVTVQDEAPDVTFNEFSITSVVIEGGTATLTGDFVDAGVTDQHFVEINWGDGTATETLTLSPGDRSFTANHIYLDDSNADNSPSPEDVYNVLVTVRDATGADATPPGLFPVIVRNAAPDSLVVTDANNNPLPSSLNEGDSLVLQGSFGDLGVEDTHQVVIDWGDGSSDTIDLAAGATSFTSPSHVYLDDAADGLDEYQIVVTVVDDDEPLAGARFEQTLAVNNVLPTGLSATVNYSSGTSANEGDSVSLDVSFDDVGINDSHRLFIDWGDGTGLTLDIDPSASVTRSVQNIVHTYSNNAVGGVDYVVTVDVLDNDDSGTLTTVTEAATINNVAPTLGAIELRDANGTLLGAADSILEGDTISLSGEVSDVGLADRHQVTIAWGDGTQSVVDVDSATRTFVATHTFDDNFTPAEITITVEDGRFSDDAVPVFLPDGGMDLATRNLTVNNVAPIVSFLPDAGATATSVTVLAEVVDPGSADTFDYVWFIDGVNQNTNAPALTFDPSALSGAPSIRLEVSDDDLGMGSYEVSLVVGTMGDDVGANALVVDDDDFAAGSEALLVLALGGDDVVDASAVTSGTVILDGGTGQDFLYGGEGDDIYILRDGDDAANVVATSAGVIVLPVGLPTAPTDAGNDRYLLKPNSTLTVIDQTGENTLDFTISDFGDNTGITFDLSNINTTSLTMQDVSASQPNQHMVDVQGNFSELVGSTFGDNLEGADDSTVRGGAGDDMLFIDGRSNASFVGGADDDVLSSTGTVTNLNFSGDDGVDVLTNTGDVTGLVFGGGADDDVFNNSGDIVNLTFGGGADDDVFNNIAGTISNLNFNGDEGADELNNSADITGLVFGGGADDDVFNNVAGTIENLNFSGDEGADELNNIATIDGLVFNGGADDDVFDNDGTVVGMLNFNGDDGADVLANDGSIATLVFGGGADDDVLNNVGSVTTLTFNGGADDDVLNNSANDIVTLNFNGDDDTNGTNDNRADDGVDVLTNTGNNIGAIVFTGGADDDVFQNDGTVTNLTFGGGADDDVLNNNGAVATLVFGGGADDDVLNNTANVTTLTFNGGADDDVLNNSADTVGMLNFNGDEGADELSNTGGGVAVLTFNGGADDDVLNNSANNIGTLNFNGDFDSSGNNTDAADDGVDALLNSGNNIGTLTFTGGADDDVFRNDGSVAMLTFNGGADDDVLINTSANVGMLNFNGDLDSQGDPNANAADDGVDQLLNTAGASVMTLTFTGGADDDVLQNDGSVINLTFGGGADDDVLQNNGSVATLTFGGGADDDILQNNGNVTTLTFNGGADDDVLINNGDGISMLNFNGDGDAAGNNTDAADDGVDALLNTGDNIGTLTFNGGADDDVFQNDGSVTNLTFGGGADDDVLQNNGEVSTLNFNGDDGADILVNNAAVATLTFTGGADDDVLTNNGDNVGMLNFNGDLDPADPNFNPLIGGDDTLIVSGSGNGQETADITFNGGAGNDAFQNNATGFDSILFVGGADDDVFQNNGNDIGNLTFNGGADDDVFENNGNGVTQLTFGGGADDDVFVNDGNGVSNLTFGGGADDDVFINTGSDVSNLNFNGDSDIAGINNDAADDGIDILVNTGDSVSGITFTGGADDDVFQNTGADVSNLNFNGDEGADQLFNSSTGIGLSNLIFNGGADDDVFINDAGAVSNLNFSGDEGADGFQNNGFSATDIVFNGGADDDVFINTADGVTNLNFNGDTDRDGTNLDSADDGVDTLQNSGDAIGTIVFNGGADDDVLNNFGNDVASLTFEGGADDDILNNTGDDVAVLNFNGDDGEDILVNDGSAVTLTFTGGADDDILQNNGPVTSLTFGGGADNDFLVNNGNNVSLLNFTGDEGADTLINNGDGVANLNFFGDTGPDLLRVQGNDLGNVNFDGAAGTDTLQFNGTGVAANITFTGGADDDFVGWQGDAANLTFDGAAGNDLVLIVGSGALDLAGGAGNDVFQFIGDPLADITIDERFDTTATDLSQDTLDFSAFTGGALNLDLRAETEQALSGNLKLTLTDELGTENVIGTPGADSINGNARSNFVSGAEFSTPFSGPIVGQRSDIQWVLLDFDSETNTGTVNTAGAIDSGEFEYTPDVRDAVQLRVEEVYGLFPNIQFVQDTDDLPADVLASGQFATILFNRTPDFGRPGGLASEIDPGNFNLDGTAQVQVNGLLGGLITSDEARETDDDVPGGEIELELEGTTIEVGDHGHGPILGDSEVGSLKPDATVDNFIRLSSKIAAHELGHLLGLRHNDSFGPIGFGVHDPPGGGSYNPVFSGPAGGFESFDHIGGSPASIGSSRFTDLNDLFLGEREAVKVAYAFADPAETTVQSVGGNNSLATAQSVDLVTLAVPNTISTGLNEDKEFFVQLRAVVGRIDVDPTTGTSQSDFYRFSGVAGELVNIDVLSNSVARFGSGPDDFVDTIVRVYDSSGNLVPYYGSVAVNDDQFEPTDSSIVDLILPETGDYFIEVDTFSRDLTDPLSDPANPDSPLNINHPANPANLDPNDPDLDLRLELFDRFVDSVNDTDQGSYQIVMYRFRKQNTSDDIDDIVGNGGADVIEGGPGDDFTLTFDLGANETIDEGTSFVARTITLNDRAASDWNGSTVDYGDGSGVQVLAVDSTGTFTLNHVYDDNGSYTVTVVINNDLQRSQTETFDVTVANTDPTVTSDASEVTIVEGNQATNTGTFSDVPANTVTLSASVGTVTPNANGTWTWSLDGDDDLAQTTVTITATDEDGGQSEVNFDVTVNNVDPSIAGGTAPITIDEGTQATNTGTFRDVLADTVMLTASLGTVTPNANGTWTWSLDGDDDLAQTTVVITATDDDGGQSELEFDVTVNNVAPTATIGNNGPIDEGQTATVSLTNAADVSAIDETAGLRFSFALTASGLAADFASASTASTADFTFNDAGTFTVFGRVIDKDNGVTDFTTDIVVNETSQQGSNAVLQPAETIVIEAEDMLISGFRVRSSTSASNGQIVRLNQLGTEDDIRTFFNGADGIYDVSIFAQDEDDGQSLLTLEINDQVIDAVRLDRDTDGGGSDNGPFSEFVFPDVFINNGDKVEIRVDGDGGEFGRIDRIELTSEERLVRATTPFSDVITDELFANGAIDWTLPQTETSSSGDAYLGGIGKTNETIDTANTYRLRQGTEQAVIEFDFLEVDSWDNERFRISINGYIVDLGQFRWQNDEGANSFDAGNGITVEKTAAVDVSGYGRSGRAWRDNDNLHHFRITVDNPGEALQIGFGSTLNQSVTDEIWGVDNFVITADGFRVVGDEFVENVESDDFTAGAAEWSVPQTATDNAGNVYLGGFGEEDGVDTERVFELPKDTETVVVEFDFLEIDTWNDEEFFIDINDQRIELGRFDWRDDEAGAAFQVGDGIFVQRSAAVDISGIGANNNNSAWQNDNLHHFRIIVTDPGSHLKLGFDANLSAGANNESWGVDNLTIDAHGVDLLLDRDFDVVVADHDFTDGSTGGFVGVRQDDGRIFYTGGELNLNGDDEYGFIPANNLHDLASGSVGLTFNTGSVSGRVGLFSRDSSGFDGGGHLSIYINNGDLVVRLQSTNQSHFITGSVPVTANTDHDVQFDFGNGGMQLYLDGALIGSNSFAGGLAGNDEPIVLGALQRTSGNGVADTVTDHLSGTISNFTIGDGTGNDTGRADYLGGFGDSDDQIVTRSEFNLPTGTSRAVINFDFLEIDTWNNESLLIEINGRTYELGSFHWNTDEAAQAYYLDEGIFVQKNVAEDVSGLGGSSGSDFNNDNHHSFTITIENPPTSKLMIGFGSNLSAPANNESWGIDNFTLRAIGDELIL